MEHSHEAAESWLQLARRADKRRLLGNRITGKRVTEVVPQYTQSGEMVTPSP